MFEKALKEKFRFSFKGSITVEDLFDLSRSDLNEIYIPLKSKLEQSKQSSLLSEDNEATSELESKIEILEYINNLKKKEALDKADLVNRKQKKLRLLELLDRKKNLELEALPVEEIEKLIDSLDA